MANEATINSSLQIRKTSGSVVTLDYQSRPTSFVATVTGTKGPTPGAVTVATGGTAIDLSQLTVPSLCRVTNLDPTNYVEIGAWNGATFYPVIELRPGESYVFRLSRNISTTLRCRANTASCTVLVEAFEV